MGRDYRSSANGLDDLMKSLSMLQKGGQDASEDVLKRQLPGITSKAEQDLAESKRQGGIKTLIEAYGAKDLSDARAKATSQGQGFDIGPEKTGVTPDPSIRMHNQQDKNGASAIQKAYDIYTKALPKLTSSAAAASEGLSSIDDPKQVGSVGQARTLMLKMMGMNRYNENEAAAVLPPNLYSYASALFNKGGDDSNPLSPVQRQSVKDFFTSGLKNVQQQHQLAKQTALGSYQVSPYFDPSRHEMLKNTMGVDFDNYLQKAIPQPTPQQPGQVQNQQPEGFMDKVSKVGSSLGSLIGIGGQKPAMASPQPPQDAFDPDSYLKSQGK